MISPVGAETMTDAEALRQALSLAENLPEKELRRALAEPALVADETLRLLSAAAASRASRSVM